MRLVLPFIRRRSRLLGVAAVLASAACGGDKTLAPVVVPANPSNPATETYNPTLGVNIAQMTKLSNDLYIQDRVNGAGPAAANGQLLKVTYTGWLPDGTVFDSNTSATAPLSLVLGAGVVIKGWDQGLVGMHVGGVRLLVIGSTLGYGAAGSGKIPPNSTLVFVVQLVSAQ